MLKRIGIELLRAAFVVAFLGIIAFGAALYASGGSTSAATRLLGAAIGDRLTLTSTSGVALTCTGQGAGAGVSCTGGGTNAAGGVFTGGATNGRGITAQGTGAGPGIVAIGGGSGADGGQFTAQAGNFNGVTANGSGTGTGITATGGGTGHAATFSADSTSPTLSTLALGTQDTNPSATAAFGDLFMFLSGSQIVPRFATATTPTWNDVAGVRTVVTGITAFAGGGQASATAVCASANLTTVATVATAGDSVKFPATPVLGQLCTLRNKGANSMNVFPGSSDVICMVGAGCLAADAATAVAANAQLDCYAESAATWNCR